MSKGKNFSIWDMSRRRTLSKPKPVKRGSSKTPRKSGGRGSSSSRSRSGTLNSSKSSTRAITKSMVEVIPETIAEEVDVDIGPKTTKKTKGSKTSGKKGSKKKSSSKKSTDNELNEMIAGENGGIGGGESGPKMTHAEKIALERKRLKAAVAMFDIADESLNGYLDAEELHKIHLNEHNCSLTLRQVQSVVSKFSQRDPEKGLHKTEFYPVLSELRRRCRKEESLRWDFKLMDNDKNNKIPQSSTHMLFKVHRGYAYKEEEFNYFIKERQMPDARIGYDEIDVLLVGDSLQYEELETGRDRAKSLRKKARKAKEAEAADEETTTDSNDGTAEQRDREDEETGVGAKKSGRKRGNSKSIAVTTDSSNVPDEVSTPRAKKEAKKKKAELEKQQKALKKAEKEDDKKAAKAAKSGKGNKTPRSSGKSSGKKPKKSSSAVKSLQASSTGTDSQANMKEAAKKLSRKPKSGASTPRLTKKKGGARASRPARAK